MSWYINDGKDYSQWGYYTITNKYKKFSSTSDTVYNGLKGLQSNWSSKNKQWYVYVPFNASNITTGDYEASSTKGIRKGFDWIDFETPGMMLFYAPKGNRSSTIEECKEAGKYGSYNKDNPERIEVRASNATLSYNNNTCPCSDKRYTTFWRAPLYFRSNWMNENARKAYNWNKPSDGVKSEKTKTVPLLVENRIGSTKNANFIQNNKSLLENETSWDHVYPMNNDNIKYNYSKDRTYFDKKNGETNWISMNKNCYDNRTNEVLGSVPQFRDVNLFINEWRNSGTTYTFGLDQVNDIVVRDIDNIEVDTNKPWNSRIKPENLDVQPAQYKSGNDLINQTKDIQYLLDSDFKLPDDNLSSTVQPSSFSFNYSGYKLPTISFATDNIKSIKSKVIFNDSVASNESAQLIKRVIGNEDVYLALPVTNGVYPNYIEFIPDKTDLFIDLFKQYITTTTNYISDGNPISDNVINGKSMNIVNFKCLDTTTFNRYRNYHLNQFNYLCNSIINSPSANNIQILKNIIFDANGNFDEGLWKSGFIFKLVDLILKSNKSSNKSLLDIIPFINNNVDFFINEYNVKNNQLDCDVKNSQPFDLFRLGTTYKDNVDYRNFGINSTDKILLKTHAGSNYAFVNKFLSKINSSIDEVKENTIISKQNKTSFNRSNKKTITDVLTYYIRVNESNLFNESKYWYLNGSCLNTLTTLCCCHSNQGFGFSDTQYQLNNSANAKPLISTYFDDIVSPFKEDILGSPCKNSKKDVLIRLGYMLKIPWWTYKPIISNIKDHIMQKLDTDFNVSKPTYSISSDIMNISLENIGMIYNNGITTQREFTFNSNSTKSTLRIYTIHQQDVEEKSYNCISQIAPNFALDKKTSVATTGYLSQYRNTLVEGFKSISSNNVVNIPTNGYSNYAEIIGVVLPRDESINSGKTVGDFLRKFNIVNLF